MLSMRRRFEGWIPRRNIVRSLSAKGIKAAALDDFISTFEGSIHELFLKWDKKHANPRFCYTFDQSAVDQMRDIIALNRFGFSAIDERDVDEFAHKHTLAMSAPTSWQG